MLLSQVFWQAGSSTLELGKPLPKRRGCFTRRRNDGYARPFRKRMGILGHNDAIMNHPVNLHDAPPGGTVCCQKDIVNGRSSQLGLLQGKSVGFVRLK